MVKIIGPFIYLSVFLFTLSYSQLIFKKGAPHVNINQGLYIGKVAVTREGRNYYEFLGIRYANPPKRFEPPESVSKLETVKAEAQRAMKPGPVCPQYFGSDVSIIGEEDCLFLNVFIPMRDAPTKDGFPVMVWIHGGAFKGLSGDSHDPTYFMDEDVIVITINYRLGALGFLSTGDDVVAGNMGLKDQTLALKWVQENMRYFGGDKKRVTIFGNSAGAASVHYLMLSPLTKGLFHNAIAQSGTAHSFWAYNPKPLSVTKQLGTNLHCPVESSNELVKCLQTKTVQEILTAQSQLTEWGIDPIAAFVPTVEKQVSGKSAFLPDTPNNIIERNEFARVPLILGVTQDEGLSISSISVMNNQKLRTELDSDWLRIAPITFNYRNWFPEEHLDAVSVKVRQFYFGDKKIDKETMQNLTDLYSDVNFVYGVWKLALSHGPNKPVYLYLLSFLDESSSTLATLGTGLDEKLGVGHGDDLQYLFNIPIFGPGVPKDSEAERFSKRLVSLWASFAKHRKPTETWGSATKWPAVSKAQLNGDTPIKWYRLDKDTEIVEDPFLDRKKFWDKLLKTYSQSTETRKDEL